MLLIFLSRTYSSTIPPTIHSTLARTSLASGFVICLRCWGRRNCQHIRTTFCFPSVASISCHVLASAPASRRPVSHQASLAGSSPCQPPAVPHVIYQSTVDRVLDHDHPNGTLSPALDEEDEDEEQQQEQQAEVGVRSLSMAKRRKHGRKAKGMTLLTDRTQTSERLTLASQMLIPEITCQTHSTSVSNQSFPSMFCPLNPSVTHCHGDAEQVETVLWEE
jgi:hypothetical protein